ncbi:hypothetical protein TNCV_1696511 [Trichonephila clavipes]|nr:hypothetical protein TNCV_1696511 [Trichonephila clavipes]
MANPKNRNSTRKSKFKGNRYTIKNNQYEINKNVRSAPTASERKLQKDSKMSNTVENEDRNLSSILKKKLEHVSNNVAYKTMNEAAAEIHEKNNFDEVVQCGVSVDGTWQRNVEDVCL